MKRLVLNRRAFCVLHGLSRAMAVYRDLPAAHRYWLVQPAALWPARSFPAGAYGARVAIGPAPRLPRMTYLNDVEDGGATHFLHYDLTVQPEAGKTLIWPAEWTHAHAGQVLNSGVKYIITGWMHFPFETD